MVILINSLYIILMIFIMVSAAIIKWFPILHWHCSVVVGDNGNYATALLGVLICVISNKLDDITCRSNFKAISQIKLFSSSSLAQW